MSDDKRSGWQQLAVLGGMVVAGCSAVKDRVTSSDRSTTTLDGTPTRGPGIDQSTVEPTATSGDRVTGQSATPSRTATSPETPIESRTPTESPTGTPTESPDPAQGSGAGSSPNGGGSGAPGGGSSGGGGASEPPTETETSEPTATPGPTPTPTPEPTPVPEQREGPLVSVTSPDALPVSKRGTVEIAAPKDGYLVYLGVDERIEHEFTIASTDGSEFDCYLVDASMLDEYWNGSSAPVYASFPNWTRLTFGPYSTGMGETALVVDVGETPTTIEYAIAVRE